MKFGWRAMWVILAVGVACSPQAVAPTDSGELDAASDVGELVDEADGGVTDAVVEVASDAIVDAPAGDVADADTADSGPDIPYWILNDVDLSGLGTITDDGFCSNVYLKVKPGDLPEPPSCTTACPAPYPCTCGACPWIETPPMNVPRFGAEAIWTGEEVLVFGGASQIGLGKPETIPFTAERWKPGGTKGFEFINLPFAATENAQEGLWVRAAWTGTEAIVFMRDHQFRFDPKTGVAVEIPLAPVTLDSHFGAVVRWAVDRLYVWGPERATYSPFKKYTPRIVTWDVKNGWQDVPFPTGFYVQAKTGVPGCATVLDGDLYAFDFGTINPASGLDTQKPLMVRYRTATKSWEALSQVMPPTVHCDSSFGNILFQSFPDGIAVIPANFSQPVAAGPGGAIWWRSTNIWTAMKPPFVGGGDLHSFSTWTGSQFLLVPVSYADPIVGSILVNSPTNPEFASWPLRYDPYQDEFGYVTSIGFPKHASKELAWVWSGTELFALGGTNGKDFQTIHDDGVRLFLPKP